MGLLKELLVWVGILPEQKVFYIGGNDVLPPRTSGCTAASKDRG